MNKIGRFPYRLVIFAYLQKKYLHQTHVRIRVIVAELFGAMVLRANYTLILGQRPFLLLMCIIR